MAAAPHIQKVLERIDREMDACARAGFVDHMLNSIEEWVRPDGWSRGVTLARNAIADTSHDDVIAAIRGKLATNRILKQERGARTMARALEWWLCGALIAEGRLKRATEKMAQRFRPLAA